MIVDRHEPMDGVLDYETRLGDLVTYGLVRVGAREVADPAVECGREEHRLALPSEMSHDAVDLRLEAHVEHAVGFVENENRHFRDGDEPAVEQVLHPTRGRDDDVRPGGELGLCAERYAAKYGSDSQVARRGDRCHRLGYLDGELARGDEDESRGRWHRCLEPLDDGNREGERLAGSGPGLRKDVVAGEGVAHHEGLDLEG